MTMSNQQLLRRGNRAIARALKFARENTALKRQLKEARTAAYQRGSAETMAAVYAALPDDGVVLLFGQWMMSSRRRTPPFNLDVETEKRVRELAVDLCRRSGIKTMGIRSLPL